MKNILRILIIDDQKRARDMVKVILEDSKYQVFEAEDGEKGLVAAKSHKPDLIILDIEMPKMDGWTFLHKLRSIPEFVFIPVIFLTQLDSLNTRAQVFRLGADDFLAKPFHFEELIFRINKAIDNSEKIKNSFEAGLQSAAQSWSLQGKLEEVGLASLLAFMEKEEQTGLLLMTSQDHTGKIFIKEGDVVKATMENSDANSLDVIYCFFTWQTGYFKFVRFDVDIEDEIQTSTTGLILESIRRLDEFRNKQN